MAFNGSGTFQRLYNWVSDRNGSIKIRADRMDAEFDGVANALTNVICKDGQTSITADIPFNNHKITGLADATAATDALNRQSGDARYVGAITGLTAEPSIADGDKFPYNDVSVPGNRYATWLDFKNVLKANGAIHNTGDATVFYMPTAPIGWTKNVTAALNDAAIRTVTDTTGGTAGGSGGFTTVLSSSRTITQANLPSVTWPDTLAASTSLTNGTLQVRDGIATGLGGGGGSGFTGSVQSTITATTAVTGSVTSGGSGTGLNFGIKYANMIHCTKV